jgi:hypothetical protein
VSDPLDPHVTAPADGDTEEIDAVIVVPGEGAGLSSRHVRAVVPAIQAAAVVATGFVAGAATAGLVRRRRDRRALVRAMPRRRVAVGGRGLRRGRGELVQIVGSRSLLVDVHLLGAPGRNR